MKITKTNEETRSLRIVKEYQFDVENDKGEVKEFMYESFQSDDDIGGYDSDESWYWKKDTMWVVIDFKVEDEVNEWLGEDIVWEELQDLLADKI